MAISTQDLVAGVDMTNVVSVSQELLNDLVNNATPAAIIGLVITTTDIGGSAQVPDATNTATKWQQYIWRRVTATSVITYVWNPAGAIDAFGLGFQLWTPITLSSIADNSITNSKYAPNSITQDKIASCAWASITGAPAFIAGTDLVPAGTFINSPYNNLVVAANGIGPTQLYNTADNTLDASRAVTNNSIQNFSIKADGSLGSGAPGKITLPSTKNMILKAENVAVPTQLQWVADWFSDLSLNVNVVTAGTAFAIPRINAGNTALEWANRFIGTDPAATLPANDTVITVAHGLGVAPLFYSVKIKCLTALAGYGVGDIIDLISFRGVDTGTPNYYRHPFSIAADATNIKMLINSTDVPSGFFVVNKGGGGQTAVTRADFVFYIYASL